MKLTVVRHAITDANKQHIINGRFNEPISEEGREQLSDFVKKLESYDFSAIYSSPLKRTMQTAMPIAAFHKTEINVDRRLIEIELGSLTMKPANFFKKQFGMPVWEYFGKQSYDLRSFGGETAAQVKRRISSFLKDLKKQEYESVLVVTHGGIIRWFYNLCENQEAPRPTNLSIHNFNL